MPIPRRFLPIKSPRPLPIPSTGRRLTNFDFVSTVGEALIDDHVPLQQAGIRTIDVIDFAFPYHHTTDDTIDKVSAASLQIVGDVAVALVR